MRLSQYVTTAPVVSHVEIYQFSHVESCRLTLQPSVGQLLSHPVVAIQDCLLLHAVDAPATYRSSDTGIKNKNMCFRKWIVKNVYLFSESLYHY